MVGKTATFMTGALVGCDESSVSNEVFGEASSTSADSDAFLLCRHVILSLCSKNFTLKNILGCFEVFKNDTKSLLVKVLVKQTKLIIQHRSAMLTLFL